MERALMLIKPDAVKRGLAGKILNRVEEKGLKVSGLKMMRMQEKQIEGLYAHHKERPFFPELKAFMTSLPLIAVAVEGKDCAAVLRRLVGATNAREAEPGTLRGDWALSNQNNLVHASESAEAGKKEVPLFFSDAELFSYETAAETCLYNTKERE